VPFPETCQSLNRTPPGAVLEKTLHGGLEPNLDFENLPDVHMKEHLIDPSRTSIQQQDSPKQHQHQYNWQPNGEKSQLAYEIHIAPDAEIHNSPAEQIHAKQIIIEPTQHPTSLQSRIINPKDMLKEIPIRLMQNVLLRLLRLAYALSLKFQVIHRPYQVKYGIAHNRHKIHSKCAQSQHLGYRNSPIRNRDFAIMMGQWLLPVLTNCGLQIQLRLADHKNEQSEWYQKDPAAIFL
jgi:hypothetical protein